MTVLQPYWESQEMLTLEMVEALFPNAPWKLYQVWAMCKDVRAYLWDVQYTFAVSEKELFEQVEFTVGDDNVLRAWAKWLRQGVERQDLPNMVQDLYWNGQGWEFK